MQRDAVSPRAHGKAGGRSADCGQRMSVGFLWLAATTGLLSLLTPCVFPMVPVTIAYFASPDSEQSFSLRRPFLFGVGIVATFTVLGLSLAATFGAAGLNRFASDPWVDLIL